jgi:hypothetical protein
MARVDSDWKERPDLRWTNPGMAFQEQMATICISFIYCRRHHHNHYKNQSNIVHLHLPTNQKEYKERAYNSTSTGTLDLLHRAKRGRKNYIPFINSPGQFPLILVLYCDMFIINLTLRDRNLTLFVFSLSSSPFGSHGD